MKISTKGRYGLRILLDIAIYGTRDKPRMMRDIAKSQKISQKYISRLVIALRKAGFISSIRGSAGGFILAKSPEKITLLNILEAMEGPIGLLDCLTSDSVCDRSKNCPSRTLWTAVNQSVRKVFAHYTLKDLLDIHTAANIVSIEYCI
ncbi:MAG: Rrf2 family transcriptional regulator [Planctomycetaceae bacterium]|jgi:Rrf2 family protein|nr:Rrf2 family transcriptional regulator [Planctomycetaceae bacterium]